MPSKAKDNITNNNNNIPPTAMSLISPPALLKAHLDQDPPTRPSNRLPSQTQNISLNTGSLTHTNGSSVVKIGATTIICGVRAELLPVSEIAAYDARFAMSHYYSSSSFSSLSSNTNPKVPTPASPETHTPITLYNLLVPNLELNTNCSPFHPSNAPPSTQAQSLSQRLYTLLLTSNLMSSADLAIVYTPSPQEEDASSSSSTTTKPAINIEDPAYIPHETEIKAYWVLYIDMVCISYGGENGVFDAAWLSLYAALRDIMLPRARWDEDEKIVLCDGRVEMGRRLRLGSESGGVGVPVSLGFAVFGDGGDNEDRDAEVGNKQKVEKIRRQWVLIDPDAFEEQCCDETGCVVVDFSGGGGKNGKILRIEKSGGGLMNKEHLKEVLGCAEVRWREWIELLERNVGIT